MHLVGVKLCLYTKMHGEIRINILYVRGRNCNNYADVIRSHRTKFSRPGDRDLRILCHSHLAEPVVQRRQSSALCTALHKVCVRFDDVTAVTRTRALRWCGYQPIYPRISAHISADIYNSIFAVDKICILARIADRTADMGLKQLILMSICCCLGDGPGIESRWGRDF